MPETALPIDAYGAVPPLALAESTLELDRPGGKMQTVVIHPAGSPAPGVILFMDMWGMRQTLVDIARGIARAGYCCMLPDVYYRLGKIRYAPQDMPGRRLNFADLERERQVALRAAMDGLSDAMVTDDAAFLLGVMERLPSVRPGAAAVVGYCMGGRHALCAAGRFPQRIRATACLHGTDLVRSDMQSPHRLAREADGEIYFGHAGRDRYAPADVAARLDQALTGCRVRYRQETYAEAQHGYGLHDRDVFDARATLQDWGAIFAMFRRQLDTGVS